MLYGPLVFGPALGGAILLASQGENLFWAFLIMFSFVFGVSTVILILGYGTSSAIRGREGKLRGLAEKAKPIMGSAFLLVGIMIFFKLHHYIEVRLLDILPVWLQDLAVKF